jgi:hypothetical protein
MPGGLLAAPELAEPVLPDEEEPFPIELLEPVLLVPVELLALEPDVPEVELPGVRTELVAWSQQLVELLPAPELDCAAATPTLTSRAADESVMSFPSFMPWPPCDRGVWRCRRRGNAQTVGPFRKIRARESPFALRRSDAAKAPSISDLGKRFRAAIRGRNKQACEHSRCART